MYKLLALATLVNPINITYCSDSECKTACKTFINENQCNYYKNSSLSYNSTYLTYYNDDSCLYQNNTVGPPIVDGSCNKNAIGSYFVQIKQSQVTDTFPGFLIAGLVLFTFLSYSVYIASKRGKIQEEKPDNNPQKLPIFSD